MYDDYVVWYCNPHIKFNKMKILTKTNGDREIIKARNFKEAEKKAFRRLVTMGMLYEVEKIDSQKKL